MNDGNRRGFVLATSPNSLNAFQAMCKKALVIYCWKLFLMINWYLTDTLVKSFFSFIERKSWKPFAKGLLGSNEGHFTSVSGAPFPSWGNVNTVRLGVGERCASFWWKEKRMIGQGEADSLAAQF